MSLQFRRGLDADRTSITPLPGEPLWITDTDELYVGDGSTAGGVLITGGGGGGAPTNATYIVQTSNGTLTNEQVLASLSTGILKNTTTTGVLSIATGTDLPSHTHTLADITDDGTMAAQNANNVAITGGSLAGVTVTTGTYSSNVNEAIMHAVRKETAGTINKGDVIRITNSSGTHLQVELADASVEATSTGTIGIAATTITNSTTGYMMVTGELTGLSNVPTASFTNGAALWLSETTGAFTTTRPTQPAHGVFLGWVVEANNGSAGRIYVKVINYQELNELHDVLINTGTLADNHFLVYDNATSLWKNESPSDARTSLGLGTAATSNTGDFASTSTQIIAGTGLTGGGDLSANRTLSVSFGTSGTTACVGNDSRLTDSRTPTAHKTSHATGGTDPLTPADIGASPVALTYVTVNDETATLTGSRRLISGGAVTLNTLSAGQIQLRRAALTGDVTAAENNNTLTIASNAVTDTKIAAGAVTMAKIAQAGAVSGDVIKWNGTAWAPGSVSGTGTVTSVTAGNGLTGGTITSSGTIAVDFHTSGTSTTVVRSDDARMTDARTPTAHTHGVGDLTATGTPSSTTFLRGDNTWATPAGGSGSVASDTIWAAKGDLAMATGPDAASVLTVGANGTMLVADSAETTGARWGAVEIPTKAFTAGTNNTTTPGLYQTVRYTATTTSITVPSGATFMLVVGAGGGGGGGGGQAMATSGAAFAGGAGGQGGQGWLQIFRLSDLSSPSTIQVTIGAGGSGGTGGATAATSNNGTAGGAGGATLLETSGGTLIARFTGGEGGGGGAGANAVGGSTASHLGWSGGAGGRGGRVTTHALAGANNYYGGGGGGGGNGATTTNSVTVCGDGGASGYFDGRTSLEAATQTNSQGTARPTTAATNGNAGSAGSGLFGGNGGSGGTGNRATTTGNAGDGGAGGAGGGGGGGGGGRQEYTTADGSRAGNGGAGGDGFLSLRFW